MEDRRFTITVTEHTTETETCGKEWAISSECGNCSDGSAYAYTPEIEKKVEVCREVYSQNVVKLNLQDVIRAVNGL